jgi:hypothetical protein
MSAYNFNLYLEKPQTEVKLKLQKETIVTLVCRRKQHLIKYRTPISVLPCQWDKEKQEVKRNKVGYASINDTLKKIIETAKTYFYDCLSQGKVFAHFGLKDCLDTELGLKAPENAITFLSFIEQFIKEAPITKEKNTIKSYKTTQTHLKDFGKKWNPSSHYVREISIVLRLLILTSFCISA